MLGGARGRGCRWRRGFVGSMRIVTAPYVKLLEDVLHPLFLLRWLFLLRSLTHRNLILSLICFLSVFCSLLFFLSSRFLSGSVERVKEDEGKVKEGKKWRSRRSEEEKRRLVLLAGEQKGIEGGLITKMTCTVGYAKITPRNERANSMWTYVSLQ